ncbi:hypothetical protein BS333_16720 [Vibrio azureus]|uniref:Uncharacterized protein n=1 Tax=Vibrio azureus NBRC 104587 TaxID=1219077 RepID=U3AAE0_9VIBR|nr:hypothetical protein [Vibrio azureus]AUI88017.1 hypothetical protein BS333_16720 [Vibrio azureus]GAD76876.1 hypothetical protein VAZ01S_055_00020 [Vibrio azureus NBRC 104587]
MLTRANSIHITTPITANERRTTAGKETTLPVKSLANAQPPVMLSLADFLGEGTTSNDVLKMKAGPVNSKAHTISSFSSEGRPVRDDNSLAINHDTQFNNRFSSLQESVASATILKNPEKFSSGINAVSKNMADMLEKLSVDSNKEHQFLVSEIVKSVSKEGQFGKAHVKDKDDVIKILKSDSDNTSTFLQKILIVRSLGAFMIDHATKDESKYEFLKEHNNNDIKNILVKYEDSNLFGKRISNGQPGPGTLEAGIRGRTSAIEGKTEKNRTDIGIMDKKDYESLPLTLKRDLDGGESMGKDRLFFRTKIMNEIDKDKGIKVASPFVKRTFESDKPLIASISGSTVCINLASEFMLPSYDKESVNVAAYSFLVGGGYHSGTEVLDVAKRDFSAKPQDFNINDYVLSKVNS